MLNKQNISRVPNISDLTKPITHYVPLNVNWLNCDNNLHNLKPDFYYSHVKNFILGDKTGLYKLRHIFNDFNPIIESDKNSYLSILETLTNTQSTNPRITIDTSRMRTNANNRDRPYHSAWHNMCFYCGKKIQSIKETQCDHVIPIIDMFVILKFDENIYKNFERVHACCNQKADKINIYDLWNKIGDNKFFPGPKSRSRLDPTNKEYVYTQVYNIIDPTYSSHTIVNKAFCKYYLYHNILKYLHINSEEVIINKDHALKNVYNNYKLFMEMSLSDLSLKPELDAANILLSLHN